MSRGYKRRKKALKGPNVFVYIWMDEEAKRNNAKLGVFPGMTLRLNGEGCTYRYLCRDQKDNHD